MILIICRASVEKYPSNPMLGRRPVVDGNAGDYAWMTYQEAYDVVMKLAASMSKSGVKQVYLDALIFASKVLTNFG
jgi:long-chain acyl-CoA synthetase